MALLTNSSAIIAAYELNSLAFSYSIAGFLMSYLIGKLHWTFHVVLSRFFRYFQGKYCKPLKVLSGIPLRRGHVAQGLQH